MADEQQKPKKRREEVMIYDERSGKNKVYAANPDESSLMESFHEANESQATRGEIAKARAAKGFRR